MQVSNVCTVCAVLAFLFSFCAGYRTEVKATERFTNDL